MKFVLPLSTLYMVASLFATVEAVPSATGSLRGSDTTATKDNRSLSYGAENIPLNKLTNEQLCSWYICPYAPKLPSDTNMQDLVEGFLENPDEFCEKNPTLCPRNSWNGEITMNCWDTSEVKSFAWTFKNQKEFNEPLHCWDTSSAEDMSGMFLNAQAFNQDVSHFDVSKVTTMNNMFWHATSFNQNINNWDVSNVECDNAPKLPSDTNMQNLVKDFLENPDEYCKKTPTLCPRSSWNDEITMQCWDTSEVKSFAYTFENQREFNEPLDYWDTSSAEDMSGMFLNARAFNQDVSHFDVSKVTTMNIMFQHATSFNQNINNWDVSNVERMYKMFCIAEDFNQCLSSWGNLVADDVDKTNMLINTKCPITTITVHGDDRMKPWCCN